MCSSDLPGSFGRPRWTFRQGDREVLADIKGRVHTSSGPGAFASALAGLGIAMASTVMYEPEVAAGHLVALLPDYELDPLPVHAVFPGGPRPSAKVRTLVDFIAERIQ